MQLLLQLRYLDPRLSFEKIAPNRKHAIKGEAYLREKLWVPHIFFQNEKYKNLKQNFEIKIFIIII